MPYLLGQIGLVGNARGLIIAETLGMPYLLGQIGLVGNNFFPKKRASKNLLTY